MSSKNLILPADVLETVMALPAVYGCKRSTNPLEHAHELLSQRRPMATQTRIVVYRYDGFGRGLEACDKVQVGLQSGTLPFHDLCKKMDVDLQLIELGQGVPTPEDNARAAAFGMMAAEEATGLLVISAFGAEQDNPKSTPDFFETTTPDVAAMFGAIVSAARAGIPVIAEGLKAYEAALALYSLRPELCGGLFVCGVPTSIADERFAIFADDAPDHPTYAAAALAALFLQEFEKARAA